jgi:hypothetical protein
VLATDPLGYLDGVAASMRRRDATVWIERSLESTGRALRHTLDAIASPLRKAHDAESPIQSDLPATFTLADVVEQTQCTAADARVVTSRWVIDGAAERVIGSSGLRLNRR